MVRIASATGVPCATSTSTWRSLETISSGVCLFLPIVVILLRLRSHTSGWTTPTGADQDRGAADFLHGLFPGSHIEKLDADVDELVTKKRRGPKRVHKSGTCRVQRLRSRE